MGKKIDTLARKRDCEDAGLWKKSIVNHMYYVGAEAPIDDERADTIEAIWLSVVNHIQDIHEHDNELYPMCGHPHLRDEDRNRQWLVAGYDSQTLKSGSQIICICISTA